MKFLRKTSGTLLAAFVLAGAVYVSAEYVSAQTATTVENDVKKQGEEKKVKSDSEGQKREVSLEKLTAAQKRLLARREVLKDSIKWLKYNDSLLSEDIAQGLRNKRLLRHRISPLGFVMSAQSVNDAGKRISYINALQRVQKKKLKELRDQRHLLETREYSLDSLERVFAATFKDIGEAKEILSGADEEDGRKELGESGKAFSKRIEERNRNISLLNKEIKNNIKVETNFDAPQNKNLNANKKGSGTLTFAENKGNIIFPLNENYTIVSPFGNSEPGAGTKNSVDNPGIDISTSPGTKALNVFDGEVASIFRVPGYDNVVVVRHGDYRTVYAGLKSLYVRRGDSVEAGQALGPLAVREGAAKLHFEVRKDLEAQNPLHWVKK